MIHRLSESSPVAWSMQEREMLTARIMTAAGNVIMWGPLCKHWLVQISISKHWVMIHRQYSHSTQRQEKVFLYKLTSLYN